MVSFYFRRRSTNVATAITTTIMATATAISSQSMPAGFVAGGCVGDTAGVEAAGVGVELGCTTDAAVAVPTVTNVSLYELP